MNTHNDRFKRCTRIGALLCVGFATGCGGGAGTATEVSVVSPVVVEGFPLQAAYRARAASAITEEFAITGTCIGTALMTSGPPVAASFESVAGFQSSQSTQVSLTDCDPAITSVTGASYLDSNYLPIGSQVDGQEYARFATAPISPPASVKPGDTATLVTLNTYTNATKLVSTGRRTVGYLVEADSASAVLVSVVQKSYNTADQLLATQQARYRLDKAGVLSLLFIDVQYSGTSQNHLRYTPKRLVASPPVSTSPSYSLLQAYKARLTTGSSERFVVSGTCNGTATLSESVPVPANFEGSAVQATSQTALLSFTDCSPGNTAVLGSNYYDSNYLLLGSSTPGQEYAKVIGTLAPLPALVQVGDAATVAALNLFTDNSKTVSTGRRTVGYAVEPGGADKVVVNFTTQTFNTADQRVSVQQVRYGLDASAAFKLLSIDFSVGTAGSLRLLYTPIPGSFTLVPAWPW